MTKKIIWIIVCALLIAGCAKLVEPGSTVSPIAEPSIAAPTPLPTIAATLMSMDSPLPTPDFESPLPTPFDSPLVMPDQSPLSTPNP